MWQKRRKTILVLSGILYVVFGVLAFVGIPGAHPEHHHTPAHNFTHILIGLLLLSVTFWSWPAARQSLCFLFAGMYMALAALGVVAGSQASLTIVPNLLEFHAEDYAVHAAAGVFFLLLGLLKRSDRRNQPRSIQA